MAKITMTGFDDIMDDLKQLQKNAKKLSQKKSLTFGEIFTSRYMRSVTPYSSIDDFLSAGGFDASTQEKLDAIPKCELDAYVAANTKFKTWDDMIQDAAATYAEKQFFGD